MFCGFQYNKFAPIHSNSGVAAKNVPAEQKAYFFSQTKEISVKFQNQIWILKNEEHSLNIF